MNSEFQELYMQKMRQELNGFSWVVDNIIGGMRMPERLEDVLPVVNKYNIGLVVSLTEHSLGYEIGNGVLNVHLPVTGTINPHNFELKCRLWCP